MLSLITAVLSVALFARVGEDEDVAEPASESVTFGYPCVDYEKGLRKGGNFGRRIGANGGSAFAGTWHLAEDVWLRGGTEVRSVATGRVMYSDFSPTWIDAKGRKHWNLGNVVVIEHEVRPADGTLTHVCSVYVHLSKDRRVQVGDDVKKGELIGFIGADRSEENGLYPEHLHFGLHRGPYYQIAPSWRRDVERNADRFGLPVGAANRPPEFVKGEVDEVTLLNPTSVSVRLKSGEISILSLETGSTSPDYQPADIIHWCSGYGDEETVAEWLKPSEWIRDHGEIEK